MANKSVCQQEVAATAPNTPTIGAMGGHAANQRFRLKSTPRQEDGILLERRLLTVFPYVLLPKLIIIGYNV